ncbi:MAG: CRISPR-associated ring nuclease [Ktedonobacteraceae bacterium]
MPEYTHTFVATLGGQPQIVTFTLDQLLRHYPISEVIVLHPYASQPRLQHSLACLSAEFTGDRYHIDGRPITCHFRSKTLELDHIPLEDIVDITGAKGTRETIYQYIQALKQEPRHIHLSVTGGRRLMALLAISAAQLEFDPFDHIWHIYTPDDLKEQVRDGKQMHVAPDAGVNLIEMPFIPLGDYAANLRPVANTAQAVQNAKQAQMAAEERARCQQVDRALTKRQRDVLRAFAAGMSPDDVAKRLNITPSTVSTHTTKIFEECRNVWTRPPNTSLSYHFLYERFGKYFDTTEQIIS